MSIGCSLVVVAFQDTVIGVNVRESGSPVDVEFRQQDETAVSDSGATESCAN